jgi:hypothetical protein
MDGHEDVPKLNEGCFSDGRGSAGARRAHVVGRTAIGGRPERGSRPCRGSGLSGRRAASPRPERARRRARRRSVSQRRAGGRPFEGRASSVERRSLSGVTPTVVASESYCGQRQKACRPAGRWAFCERAAVARCPNSDARRSGRRVLSGHTGIADRPDGRWAPSGGRCSFTLGTQSLDSMTAFLGFMAAGAPDTPAPRRPSGRDRRRGDPRAARLGRAGRGPRSSRSRDGWRRTGGPRGTAESRRRGGR